MKKLTGSTFWNVIVVIAIAVVPLMYGGLLTSAYQNPTNRVSTIKAAVVNEDSAADVELATGSTEHFALGDELEKRLTAPEGGQDVGFTWVSMSADEAETAMGNQDIRAELVIPAGFTQAATTVGTADAAQVAQQRLELRTDDGINYLAGTLAKSVASELENQLTAEGADTYVDNILMSLGTIRSGMEDAQSGATALASGSDTLQSGLSTLSDGTATAADGASQLADGATAAADGASTAATGANALQAGIDELAAGAPTLKAGIDQYTSGVDTAAVGAGALASGVNDYTAGVSTAASGAQQLAAGASGLTTLSDGITQYSYGVDQLKTSVVDGSGDTAALATGAQKLAAGTAKLQSTLAEAGTSVGTASDDAASSDDGNPTLVAGAKAVADGTGQLQSAAESSVSSVKTLGAASLKLADSTEDYTGSVDKIVSAYCSTGDTDQTLAALCTQLTKVSQDSGGLNQLASGVDGGVNGSEGVVAQASALETSSIELNAAAGRVATGAKEIATALAQANDATSDESVPALNAGAQQIAAGVGSPSDVYDATTGAHETVAGVLNTLSSQSQELRDGASKSTTLISGTSQLSSGLTTLNSNSAALTSGASAIDTGTQQLTSKSDELRSGVAAAASGADQLSDGSTQLTAGLRELADGTATLASKTGALATGLTQLDTGATSAKDGASALATGATELASGVDEGVDRIPDYSDSDASSISTMISDPVSVDAVRDHAVVNNGAGFTPMFLSLALWIGGIAIFLVLPALDRRPGPTERWWMAPLRPATTATIFGIAQAVLLMVLTNGLVELKAANIAGLVAMGIASSLTFVALNQMFVAILAYRGRFLSIFLLCLQITSMGATFPIETTPKFFQWIHPFLPMSYTQLAFRDMIAGAGASHAIRNCLLILALYFVIAIAGIFIAAYARSGAKPLPRDNALLGDSMEEEARVRAESARVREEIAGGSAPAGSA